MLNRDMSTGLPHVLANRGYAPIYRNDEVNHCPGCGRSQWYVGRSTAECAYCATSLPLQHTGFEGVALGGVYWDRDQLRHGWHVGDETRHSPHEQAVWG